MEMDDFLKQGGLDIEEMQAPQENDNAKNDANKKDDGDDKCEEEKEE